MLLNGTPRLRSPRTRRPRRAWCSDRCLPTATGPEPARRWSRRRLDAGSQNYDAIAKALRPIYTAPTEAAATERFLEFCEAWGERYPAIVRLWENTRAEFVPFLSFDAEIRNIVCTSYTRKLNDPLAGFGGTLQA